MFVTGSITKEQRTFPSYKFILMGIFDSLSVLISTIPASYVSGSVNVVMSQSVVLVNMIASFIFLHLRYSPFHICGVILVMIGITVDVWPMFAGGSAGSGQYTWLWILLLFFANIPMAASNVYKEKYLKQAVCNFYISEIVLLN
jgi:drug/metabolite transporter (DMT)-like permease